jgi:hypothetical protein
MSTIEIIQPETPAPAGAPRPWYRHWYAWAALAALIAGAAAALFLTVFADGYPDTPAGHLQRDGYSVAVALGHAQIVKQLGTDGGAQLAAGWMDTAAYGTKGSSTEAVVKMTPAGRSALSLLVPLMQSAANGVTVKTDGDYLIVTGPTSKFEGNVFNFGGSGSAASPAPSQSPSVAQAVNPVDIVQQAGATPAPGSAVGTHDINGNRMADGTFGGQYGEQITVYTSADDAAFQQSQDTVGQSDDAHAVITIPAKRAVIMLTATIGDNGGYVWTVSPEQVAKRVGGLNILSPDQAASYSA